MKNQQPWGRAEPVPVLQPVIYPKLQGLSVHKMTEFLRKYDEYYVYASSGYDIPMPMRSCIAQKDLTAICKRWMNPPQNPGAVTNEVLIAWLRKTTGCKLVRSDIEEVVKAVPWPKTGLLRDRIMTLVSDLEEAVQRAGHPNYLDDVGRTIDAVTSKLEPIRFRKEVELELSTCKEMKESTNSFLARIVEKADLVQPYMDLIQAGEDLGKAKKKGPEPTPPAGSAENRTGEKPRNRYQKRREQNTPTSQETAQPESPAPDTVGKGRTTYGVKCFNCGGQHKLQSCPTATPEQKRTLWRDWQRGQERGQETPTTPSVPKTVLRIAAPELEAERLLGRLQGVHETTCLLDTGSAVNVLPLKVLNELEEKEVFVPRTRISAPFEVCYGSAKHRELAERKCRLDFTIAAQAGPVKLQNLEFVILDHCEDVLLGKPLLRGLGVDVKAIMMDKIPPNGEFDCSQFINEDLGRINLILTHAGESEDDADEQAPTLEFEATGNVKGELDAAVERAREAGLPLEKVEQLSGIVSEHMDVWRLGIQPDPPVKTEPMDIKLREGAPAYLRCDMRKYSPVHREYLRKHLDELLAGGLIAPASQPQYIAPVYVVPKGEKDFRMTVDLRRLNQFAQPMQYPVPNVNVLHDLLLGSSCYMSFDMQKGFWQMPISSEAGKLMAFSTPFGVYEPTRVLMGYSGSVQFFQQTMDRIFADLLHVNMIIYIDDLLVYAKNVDDLLQTLSKVLERCEEFNIKLNLRKASLYAEEITFCGRQYSAAGVAHCPERIQALTSMKPPETGDQLSRYLHAIGWMRDSLPRFAERTARLHQELERIYAEAGSRKTTAVKKVAVKKDDSFVEAFQNCQDMLASKVCISYPSEDQQVLLFTDASDEYWAAVITQIPLEDVSKAVAEQRHEPLLFLSGRFSGSQLRWAIPDKEGYAIVAAFRRASYLLQQRNGVLICTDHRNLTYIFAPDAGMKKTQLHRLHRWAIELMQFNYTIVHLPGKDNAWADLLSRWEQAPTVPSVAVCRILTPHRTTSLALSEWPGKEELMKSQRVLREEEAGGGTSLDSGVLKDSNGAVIVPQEDTEMIMRLLVIAHAGAAGHRGVEATLARFENNFVWKGMREDVTAFIRSCIHCISDGPTKIPRPFGKTVRADQPNQVLHFDFMKLGGSGGKTYLLVLKDNFSQYIRLYPCDAADSMNAVQSLLDWIACYGAPEILVSDQGTHFKNKVVEELTRITGIKHKFTHAYMPWANGSVERANGEILKVLRKMICEAKAKPDEWEPFIPLVQSTLNSAPRERMANYTPIKVFLQLEPDNPVQIILKDGHIKQVDVQLETYMSQAAEAMDQMHKEVEQLTRKESPPTGIPINFTEGDFVLLSSPLARRKLQAKWRGPYRVTKLISEQIALVEHIITGELQEAHTSRLKLYADSSLELTADLLQHAETTTYRFEVEQLKRLRQGENGQEILVSWRGFPESMDTWEPLDNIREDVPALVEQFMHDE